MVHPLPTARPAPEPSRKTGGGGWPGLCEPDDPPPLLAEPDEPPPPLAETGADMASTHAIPTAKLTAIGFWKLIIICLLRLSQAEADISKKDISGFGGCDLVHGREDFFVKALGFLNVENALGLSVFFKSPADGVERVVAMSPITAFIEKGELGHGEFFLGLRPKEWRVLAGPFLQRFMKGGDRLLQPCRPTLALPEDHKRGTQIGFGRSPVERHAVAGLFCQRVPIGSDRLLQPSGSALARSTGFKRIAETGLGLGPVEGRPFTGVFLQRCANGSDGVI